MSEPSRVFVSHSSKDLSFTQRFVGDLRHAGADVWADLTGIAHDDFVRRINEGFTGRQWVVLILSPDALRSEWVQREINAALTLIGQGRMRGVIPVIAKHIQESDMPALWTNLHRYDATYDYDAALQGVLAVLGLNSAAPHTTAQLIVDPRRQGGYKTIGEALAAATPGDQIALFPAVYRETLTFTKPVQLLGQGDREKIIIAPPNKTGVTVASTQVRMTNLSLWIGAPADVQDLTAKNMKDVALARAATGGAVAVAALVIALGLSFWPMLGAAAIVAGVHQLASRVSDNLTTEPEGVSLLVAQGAEFELTQCIVRNSVSSGVISHGRLRVYSSRIFACKWSGVEIRSDGEAQLEDNDIILNARNGVTSAGALTAINNRIYSNHYHAVEVGKGSKGGVFEDNVLTGNQRGAWKVDRTVSGLVRRERNAE